MMRIAGFMSKACTFLRGHVTFELPLIKKDRGVRAFRNGLYDQLTDKFIPYTKHQAVSSAIVACRYHDVMFPQVDHIPKDMDEQAVRAGNPLLGRWSRVPIPALKRILDHQFNGDQVMLFWFLALYIGRPMYAVNQLEQWQVFAFIMGLAWTGKSTIISNVLWRLYDSEDIGVMANNIEQGFGLAALADKLLVVGPELRADWNISQADFQSMTSGEGLSVRNKHQKATNLPQWTVPAVGAGNQVAGGSRFTDSGGSVARRMIVFRFVMTVLRAQTNLSRELREQLAEIIVAANWAYLLAVRMFGTSSIWEHLPAQFMDSRKEVQRESQGLMAFLSSTEVYMCDGAYCPKDKFITAMTDYCKRNFFRQAHLSTDDLNTAFGQYNLCMARRVMPYPRTGAAEQKRDDFIMGVDLVSNLTADERSDMERITEEEFQLHTQTVRGEQAANAIAEHMREQADLQGGDEPTPLAIAA